MESDRNRIGIDHMLVREPRSPGALSMSRLRVDYWFAFRMSFAFVPASLIAASGVALPVVTLVQHVEDPLGVPLLPTAFRRGDRAADDVERLLALRVLRAPVALERL